MTSGTSKHPIYPEYCHALSPTINEWCPLRATDIHALDWWGMFNNGRSLYHHSNHPIKWVRLTGVIVAVDEFYGRKVYTLDDSSGKCIECTCPAPLPPKPTILLAAAPPAVVRTKHNAPKETQGPTVTNPLVPWEEVDVGVVVKIKGGVRDFRDERQVEIIKVEVLRSTDEEVRCWNGVLAFRKDILSLPWVVTKEQEEEYKRIAMREKKHEKKGNAKEGMHKKIAGNRDDRKQKRAAESREENSGTRHKRGANDRDGQSERRQRARTEDQDRKPEKRQGKSVEDRDAARHEVSDGLKRDRKDRERREKHEQKRRSRRDGDGLGPAKNGNYPSLPAKRIAAGK